MKSGTGDDPFAEEPEEEPDEPEVEQESGEDPELEHDQNDSSAQARETETAPDSAPDTNTDESVKTGTRDTEPGASSDQIDSQDIPWVLRRGGVKDDRPNMTQFFLRDSTDQAERGFQQDVENILDKDVYLLDLREAAYQVAMDHPEEVAAVLEEWGYDYL
jgi:hypothetical protein